MVTREDIVAEARTWLGTPWKHQGRTRLGVDCAGLIIVIAKALDLSDYDTTGYGRSPVPREFMREFEATMNRKPVGDTLPGDVLLFRDRQHTCHSALVADKGGSLTIIHAYASRRRVVEDRLDQGDWLARRSACFEFRGL